MPWCRSCLRCSRWACSWRSQAMSSCASACAPWLGCRKDLEDVRTGRSQRIGDDQPRELLPLVHDLNALIVHNAEGIRRARGHVANLGHALNTPLAALSLSLGAGNTPGDAERLELVAADAGADQASSRPRAFGGHARTGICQHRHQAAPVGSRRCARQGLCGSRPVVRCRCRRFARRGLRAAGFGRDARQPARQCLQVGVANRQRREPRGRQVHRGHDRRRRAGRRSRPTIRRAAGRPPA